MRQSPLTKRDSSQEAPGVLKLRSVRNKPIDKKVSAKSGITLIELMIVVIIIGILATLALPRYIKVVENIKAKEAIVSLEQIRYGEIAYRKSENAYWPAGGTESDIHTINDTLRLFLDTREVNWKYSVNAGSSPPGNTFTATAIRTSGRNKDETITLDENGTQGGSWTP